MVTGQLALPVKVYETVVGSQVVGFVCGALTLSPPLEYLLVR